MGHRGFLQFNVKPANMVKAKVKALMVLTNHREIAGTHKGGWYLEELAHPYKRFQDEGYEITICSIKGGDVSGIVDPDSLPTDDSDVVKKDLYESEDFQNRLKNTAALSSFKGSDFDILFLVGGYGVMWDFFPNADINRVGRETYESNGIVGAVCHGPIGLASITLSDGSRLVNGKSVAGFNNEEENIIGIKLPSHPEGESCEDVLTALGGKYTKSKNVFEAHVAVDDRLVSGQNPASADPCAAEIIKIIKSSVVDVKD